MYNGLQLFKVASAMARHATERQSVIAQNIANSDTPGYAARDLKAFSAEMVAEERRGELRVTRAGHIPVSLRTDAPDLVPRDMAGDASPNGNTVSIETEMMKSAAVRQQHDLALATYRGGLDLMRAALGRGR